VILEDNKPDTPDPKAAAVSASVEASADSAFELSKPIDPSDHEAWYDVEAGCYVDEELPLSLEPEQEGSAASTLATTPLSHHTTGSTSMIMMETLNAHQKSQHPILYLNRWTRTVEE